MAASLKSNPLIVWTVVANAIYWLAGALTPNPYVSSAASLALLLSSAWMFLRYAPHAFDVVVHGRRDSGDGGQSSHLALYGATLIAGGSCYVGLFGFLWILADQPTDWLGTTQSGYGRAVMSVGFAMMAMSPDRTPAGVRMPNVVMIVLLIIAVAVGSFFAGRKTVPQEQAVYWRAISGRLANRPVCRPDQTVWGSSNKIYHEVGSPYRDQVIPQFCFETPTEAEESGFRAPKFPN